jgi:hypothetical protein
MIMRSKTGGHVIALLQIDEIDEKLYNIKE